MENNLTAEQLKYLQYEEEEQLQIMMYTKQ